MYKEVCVDVYVSICITSAAACRGFCVRGSELGGALKLLVKRGLSTFGNRSSSCSACMLCQFQWFGSVLICRLSPTPLE